MIPVLGAEDSTDPLARWLAIGGLAVASLSLLLGAHREWRDRARLGVELGTTTVSMPDGLNRFNALVKVRNRGRRPITVEQINFERADGSTRRPLSVLPTRIPGLETASSNDAPLHAFGINTQPPPAPLAEGEILIWSYQVQETDEPWTGSSFPPMTPFRAVVTPTKGKRVSSNEVGLVLRPWRVPPESD